MRHISFIGLLLLAACAKEAAQNVDTAAVAAGVPAAPATPPVAGTFTKADVTKLRWLEGKWEGFMPDGKRFYESYTFQDDSTILQQSFPDSSFGTASDRSRILLRGGVLASESDKARWVATHLDSASVAFAPERGANNSFTFAREDATKWNAMLRWTDAQGRSQSTLYAMHRYGR